MTSTIETIKELLSPLAAGLEADGYSVDVDLQPDLIALEVVAGPDACEDCLVPKDIMREIFRSRLSPEATGLDHDNVELTYPDEA